VRHGPATARPDQLRQALTFAEALLDVCDFRDVEGVLLSGLARLTGSDMAVYHHVDVADLGEINLAWPAAAFTPQRLEAYSSVMAEHPLVAHFQANTYSHSPICVSDLLSTRQWRATRVYSEALRGLGAENQMSLVLASRGSEARAVSVCRRGATYRDGERELLALVRPHLLAALRRAYARSSDHVALRVVPHVEYVRLDALDRVLHAPVQAATARALTAREHEVLCLMSTGLTNRQVAGRLHLSEATVRKHLEHIYPKLGVDNRVAAARLVAPEQLIPRPRTSADSR